MHNGEANVRTNSADILRLVICSNLRKNLILALNHNGSASLAELSGRVDASSTAATRALSKLEKDHLTYRDDKRNYKLTNVGAILALKLENLVKTANVLTEHSSFWLKHELSGIPTMCLENIYCLEDAHLLTNTPTDVLKVFSTFLTLLENSREMRGVFPILTPDFVEVFIRMMGKGVPIELIVTREVLDKILESSPPALLKRGLDANLKLFVINRNPRISFTVTDYFVIVGLYRFDESYDYSDELVCYSKEGMRWGHMLLNYYRAMSERFILEG